MALPHVPAAWPPAHLEARPGPEKLSGIWGQEAQSAPSQQVKFAGTSGAVSSVAGQP